MKKAVASEMILTVGILVATGIAMLQLRGVFYGQETLAKEEVIVGFANDLGSMIDKAFAVTGDATFSYHPSIKKYTLRVRDNKIMVHDKISGKNVSFIKTGLELVPNYFEDSEVIFISKIEDRIYITPGTVTTTIPRRTTTTIPSTKLTLLIIPVNWDGDFSSYKTAADDIALHFLERIPLSECPEEKFNYMIVDGSTDYGKYWRGWYCYIPDADITHPSCYYEKDAVERIYECAKEYKTHEGIDYDYVAGIDNSDIASKESDCNYRINGWTFGGSSPSVIAESMYKTVVTHELGHKFGLRDEYCDCSGTTEPQHCGTTVSPNPLKKELGCGGKGSDCCWYDHDNYPYVPGCYLCYGNFDRFGKDTDNDGILDSGKRSVMASGNIDHHDTPSYKHLKTHPKLQC